MSRGKRIRLARSIYRDRYGIGAIVKVAGRYKELRFTRDTPLSEIEPQRARARADLLDELAERAAIDDQPPPTAGTFKADTEKYLKQIEGRASYKSDRSHLKAWLPFVGSARRSAIKTSHVKAAIAAWVIAKKSPRTIRHRRRVFRELYQALDGAHARPPLAGVKIPSIPAPNPMPVSHAMIRRVAKSLLKGKRHAKGYGDDSVLGYARFLVRATTGQRPAQIMRAKRKDVDLQRRIWFVRSAKGGYAIPLPLNAEMVRAWQAFIKANAWGQFDTRSFSKLLRRHGWPKDERPYNLRHTFAIDHLLQGTRLEDLQGLLGHRQIETTRAHYAPVLLALLKKTVGKRRLRLD